MSLHDFIEFTRVEFNFTVFRVFCLILHAKYKLTCKIIRLYKSTYDFDNLNINLFDIFLTLSPIISFHLPLFF
jgi:hypothetical protein